MKTHVCLKHLKKPDNIGCRAFSLVELLTVIAIIAILAALLIPATGMARNAMRTNATQAQFRQIILAYEAFKAEYGYYPNMGASGNRFELFANNEVFIETLSGRSTSGGPLTTPYARARNKKNIPFFTFSEGDFIEVADPDYGGLLGDAFGNPNIVIVIDDNQDGLIPVSDLGPGLPADAIANGQTAIRAGVAIFSDNSQANTLWRWVYSWQ